MLDENLPAFFYRKSPEGISHHEAIYHSYQGSDPSPTYQLQHADPKLESSRNCYAAALFDSHNPDVLYGEVLVRPTWAHTTLSQEEIRRNGGVPPPPQPIIPAECTIQLYEPDQQVTVKKRVGGLSSSTTFEFDLPTTTFRTPSVSTLDRTQSDPAASVATPKLNFVWRKESKLSKDYTCFMTGKSTDSIVKRKNRDPDIAIALFRSLRELTIFEPNLSRVEVEDSKGLEVVLLLSAATMRDIWINSHPAEFFNIHNTPTRKLSSGGRKMVPTPASQIPSQRLPTVVNPNVAARPLDSPPVSHPSPPAASQKPPARPARATPPIKDARQQWEIDAETARLKAQVAAEEREAKRVAAQRQKDKAKADEAETKRLRKLVEAEEKEARRRQKEIDGETERLRKKYGPSQPQLPVRPASAAAHRPPRTGSGGPQGGLQPIPQGRPVSVQASPARPMYNHANPSTFAPSYAMMSGAAGPSGSGPYLAPPPPHQQQGGNLKGRKSFFSLRDLEDEMKRVTKKKSSLW